MVDTVANAQALRRQVRPRQRVPMFASRAAKLLFSSTRCDAGDHAADADPPATGGSANAIRRIPCARSIWMRAPAV